MSTLREQENQLWADFERRTEHMTGRELAAEMDRHIEQLAALTSAVEQPAEARAVE
jgi:hypothetical protein